MIIASISNGSEGEIVVYDEDGQDEGEEARVDHTLHAENVSRKETIHGDGIIIIFICISFDLARWHNRRSNEKRTSTSST